MGAQRAAEIEPGSILQQHVEHDEVMCLPGKRLVHLRTAFGRRDLKALRREIARKELPDLQIVVDDQDVRVAIQAWPRDTGPNAVIASPGNVQKCSDKPRQRGPP